MNPYAAAKAIHVGCAIVSVTGFAVRYALAACRPELMRHRFIRIAPHVNDTLLLAAAIAMLVIARYDLLAMPWLGAKVVGLVVYVGLGTVALKRGRTPRIRAIAFVGALAAFGYIVSVALSKSAAGPFAWIG